MTHALLAPSSSHQWLRCPASVLARLSFPDPDGPEAEEGNRAHSLALRGLNGQPWDGPDVPQEMADGVSRYIAVCQSAPGVLRGAETHIRIDRVHSEHCAGTPDYWAFDEPSYTLTVVDFKYGHREVNAEANPQLMLYAIGLIDHLRLDDQRLRLNFLIVQPRAFHRATSAVWSCSGADLRNWGNQLQHAAELALGPDPRAVAGEWCRDCPARLACPAATARGVALFDATCRADFNTLDAGSSGRYLTWLGVAIKHLARLEKAISADVEARLAKGQPVDGWALKHVPGRLGWSVDDATVLAVAPQASRPGVMTPAQAKAAGVDAALVDSLSSRGTTTKLTPLNLERIFK